MLSEGKQFGSPSSTLLSRSLSACNVLQPFFDLPNLFHPSSLKTILQEGGREKEKEELTASTSAQVCAFRKPDKNAHTIYYCFAPLGFNCARCSAILRHAGCPPAPLCCGPQPGASSSDGRCRGWEGTDDAHPSPRPISGSYFGEGVLRERPPPLCTPKHQPQLLRGQLVRGIESEHLSAGGRFSGCIRTVPSLVQTSDIPTAGLCC